ncbi:MAG: hypothetical protein FWD97_00525 [Defluviitaleaceae bacterium]|nr:hypothetical protein [Defluviitaleaceae bacterium]
MKYPVKINTKTIPPHVIRTLCRPLIDTIQSAYKDPVFAKKYIEYHKNKYGELPSNHAELQKVIAQAQA